MMMLDRTTRERDSIAKGAIAVSGRETVTVPIVRPSCVTGAAT